MSFGDLQSRDGLSRLNVFLVNKSYIEGYCPTQADVVAFEAMKRAPPADFENAVRWYKHISSFTAEERQKFEGQRQSDQGVNETKSTKLTAIVDENDIDLFSDDEDEEESELRKQRLEAYAQKKATKPVVVAKSEIVFDVKPLGDETNMEELERNVRSIEMDGLLWGGSRFAPVAYGIKMLQITCVVEDEKVSTDILEERITAFEDHVQSVDIVAFRRI